MKYHFHINLRQTIKECFVVVILSTVCISCFISLVMTPGNCRKYIVTLNTRRNQNIVFSTNIRAWVIWRGILTVSPHEVLICDGVSLSCVKRMHACWFVVYWWATSPGLNRRISININQCVLFRALLLPWPEIDLETMAPIVFMVAIFWQTCSPKFRILLLLEKSFNLFRVNFSYLSSSSSSSSSSPFICLSV